MSFVHFLTQPIVNWLNHQRLPREVPLSNYERIRTEIKQCDVILIEGRSRVSEVIKLITQSPWSHAALYLGRLHDIEDTELRQVVEHHYGGDPADQLMIESLLGRGTIIRTLSAYEQDHVRISRPTGLEYKDSQEVIRYAISRLGTDYDVRQIFDLARFLFPWVALPRRWRSTLFNRLPGQSTKTVCSTMIAEAFGFVQFPILPLVRLSDEEGVQLFRSNPRLCTPNHFDYSPYFEIIKYPFINFSTHHSYHLLPWKGRVEDTDDDSPVILESDETNTRAQVEEAISQALENTLSQDSEDPDEDIDDDPDDQPRLLN